MQSFPIKKNGQKLLVTSILLLCFGLIAIYGASAMKATQQMGSSFVFLQKQLTAVALACFLSVIILKIPFSWFQKLSLPLLVFSFVGLILVFVPGLSVRAGGAQRWVNLIVYRFQPSELAKIAFVFFLAKTLSRPDYDVNSVKYGLAPIAIIYVFFAALLLKQPDLGSAALIGCLTVLMLYGAGLKKKFLGILAASSVAALTIAIISAPYRLKRMFSFLDPWSQAKEGGFQIIQSLLAFQNGGLLGVGLGESKQKLYFLPEAHTDFILSVLAEELGFFGVLTLILLFSYICFLGFQITFAQKSLFRRHLAFGLTLALVSQAILNMGVAMGLLPTKGMPLPFISSGANSMIASILMVVMLFRLTLAEDK